MIPKRGARSSCSCWIWKGRGVEYQNSTRGPGVRSRGEAVPSYVTMVVGW